MARHVVDDDDKKPKPYDFAALKGVAVVVRANGFTYRGVLIGADDSDLYLRGEMRYLVLPLGDVTSVSPEKPPRPLGLPKDVDE